MNRLTLALALAAAFAAPAAAQNNRGTYTLVVPMTATKLPLKTPSGAVVTWQVLCQLWSQPDVKGTVVNSGLGVLPLDANGSYTGNVNVKITGNPYGTPVAGQSYWCQLTPFANNQQVFNPGGGYWLPYTPLSSGLVTGNGNFP